MGNIDHALTNAENISIFNFFFYSNSTKFDFQYFLYEASGGKRPSFLSRYRVIFSMGHTSLIGQTLRVRVVHGLYIVVDTSYIYQILSRRIIAICKQD
jgi:hypothetical protein